MPEYYTPQEVAEKLRVHVNTIYRYLDEGQFPNHRRVKRSYRIPQGDVEEFLARREPSCLPESSSPQRPTRRIISAGLT